MKNHRWDSVPRERVADDIARRMVIGEKEMLVRWEFKQGALAAWHAHRHEQVVMMVGGRLRLAAGEEETAVGPKRSSSFRPGAPHATEALEDCVAIDIFSPP